MIFEKHPDVIKYQNKIDMSDMEADKLVMFQNKYYLLFILVASFIVPVSFLYFICNETLLMCITYGVCERLALVHHGNYSINSFAHKFGSRGYDK